MSRAIVECPWCGKPTREPGRCRPARPYPLTTGIPQEEFPTSEMAVVTEREADGVLDEVAK